MKKKFIYLFSILLIFSCKSFLEKQSQETNISYDIRVKLRLRDRIVITLSRDIAIKDAITSEDLFKNKFQKKININFVDKKCFINDIIFQSPVIIFSKSNRLIKINDKYYFGVIKIIPEENGLEIINNIPIETYLISVVQSEMPLDFHPEALKTQAIIARTYSYYFMKNYGNLRNFDVDNTVNYQVYNGFINNLNPDKLIKLLNSIKESRGMIIEYEGNPIIAYFHSNSGGRLRSGKDYFGESSDLPYLTGKNDPYSLGKPNDRWNYNMKFDDFKNKMNITSDLSDDMIIYNNEGFVDNIKLGDIATSSKDIRKIIGYFNLKSERFKIVLNKDENMILFEGIGFGHGVGLSQWGAEAMAAQGFNFNEIINFYYPETTLGFF